jgi:hypothetical protein
LCSCSGENHVRLKNTSHVLLSNVSATATSGLPGIILTLADMGQKKLTIVGPTGTRSYVDAASAGGFIHRPEQQLTTVDVVDGSEAWDAPNGIEITAIAVSTGETNDAATAADTAAAAAAAAATVAAAAAADGGAEPPAKRRATEQAVQGDSGVAATAGVANAAPPGVATSEPVQLFVGNLAYSVDQASLRSAFNRFCGDAGVNDAKVIMDHQTGKPRGFGFVTLPSAAAAEAAIELAGMGLLSIDGRSLRVGRADRGGSGRGGGANGDAGWTMASGQKIPGLTPPPSDSTISYICQLPTSRGKFNKARAIELGVKVGPDFGRLAAGQSVTTATGAVVKPADVVGETVVGACLFVVECPTLASLAALSKMPQVAALCAPSRKPGHPLFVAHFTPARVACASEYLGWMHSFGPDARHMLLYTPPSSPSAALFSDAGPTTGREMPTFVASAVRRLPINRP